jgi:hypothetical protein
MISQQPYDGNNAVDYQPPTDNPQNTQTNLQPTGETAATDNTDNELTQQNLPSVRNLKVVVVQDSANSKVPSGLTPVQTARETWVGPFVGTLIIAAIIVITWAMKTILKELSARNKYLANATIGDGASTVTNSNNENQQSSKTTSTNKRRRKNSKKKKRK